MGECTILLSGVFYTYLPQVLGESTVIALGGWTGSVKAKRSFISFSLEGEGGRGREGGRERVSPYNMKELSGLLT